MGFNIAKPPSPPKLNVPPPQVQNVLSSLGQAVSHVANSMGEAAGSAVQGMEHMAQSVASDSTRMAGAAVQASQFMPLAAQDILRGAVTSIFTGDMNASLEGVRDAAGHVMEAATTVQDAANQTEFMRAVDILRSAAVRIPDASSNPARGMMALPHVPPRPDMGRAAAAFDTLAQRLGLPHGGWPKPAAMLDQVKPDGTFTLKGGALGASAMATLQDAVKDVLGARTTGGDLFKSLGYDLASRCAEQPLLSAILSKLPRGLEALMHARGQVTGGVTHLKTMLERAIDPNGPGGIGGPVNRKTY